AGGLGAAFAVVAVRAVGLRRVRADAGLRIAGAGAVTLVGGCALDGAPDAGARLAAVRVRAGIAVIAAGAVGLRRVRARPGLRIAGAGAVALVGGRARDGRPDAVARLPAVGLRAGGPVIAA